MNVLPVIARELQVRARQPATYWSRCGVAAMTSLAGVLELVNSWSKVGPAAAGPATFTALSTMGFLLACGATVVTADTLSGEKRDGTLGLLLLTELKGYDVVFGKLTGAGLSAVYALTGLVPALALVVLTGGVSGGLVARTALALLSALFLGLAAGMFVSARSQRRPNALRGALLLVAGLGVLPRIAMNIGLFFTSKAWMVASLSPFTAWYLADDTRYAAARAHYWVAVLVTFGAGWVLLGWTARYLVRNWQAAEKPATRHAPLMLPVMVEEAHAMTRSRTELMQADPICWSVSRLRIQSLLIWSGTLLLLLGGTGVSWGSLIYGSSGGLAEIGVLSSVYLLVVLTAASLVAWAAGRFLFEAKRSGELELLLSTPLGARDIIGGNWRALSQPLRGAWLLVVFMILFQIVFNAGPGGLGLAVFQRAMVPLNRILDVVAVCWVAMWFGLSARKPFAILAWTVGLVIGLPWVVSCMFVVAGTSGNPALLFLWFGAWPVIELVKDAAFIGWAASKLRTELRTQASVASGQLFK